MKRFAAQFLVQDADNWLRNRVVEQNEDLCLTAIYNLSEIQSETAHTLFFDGVITPFPLQLPSEFEMNENINSLLLTFSGNQHTQLNKPQIFNLLADRLDAFTHELRLLAGGDLHWIFNQCIFNHIAGVYEKTQMNVGQYPVLVLWQNVDLKELKLTSSLQIKLISPSF